MTNPIRQNTANPLKDSRGVDTAFPGTMMGLLFRGLAANSEGRRTIDTPGLAGGRFSEGVLRRNVPRDWYGGK